MKIKYNVTGSERKRLADYIAGFLGCQRVYLGAPTYAYKVGYMEVSRDGTLCCDDRFDSPELRTLLAELEQEGFTATEAPQDACDGAQDASSGQEHDDAQQDAQEATDATESASSAQEHDDAQQDAQEATDVTESASSAQERDDAQRDAQDAEGATESASSAQEHDDTQRDAQDACDATESAQEPEDTQDEEFGLTIGMPLDKVNIENLNRLLDAKGALIKKALDVDSLPVEVTEDSVKFPWFKKIPSPDESGAYIQLVAALCKMSVNQKRITVKEKPVENERYAFRCFLLRLGFIGDDFKAERKVLLRNLQGSSAFKSGQKAGVEKVGAGNAVSE